MRQVSDGSENSSSPPNKTQLSESAQQSTGVGNADMKPVSPPSQSTSPPTLSQMTEVPPAITNKQLEQIDSAGFMPSPRSLKMSSSQSSSPQLSAAVDVTSANSSLSASASPDNHQPSSLLSLRKAGQVLQDSSAAMGMKSPTKSHSPMVQDGSPLCEVSSRRSCPGSMMRDRLAREGGKNEQQPLTAPSTQVSDVDSPSSAASEPGRFSTMKLPGDLDSDPSVLSSKKNIGRGKKIMAVLKCSSEAAEVGARASRSLPELAKRESCSKYFEQLPEQMPMLSAGLDEDSDSFANPVNRPHPGGGDCQVVGLGIGKKAPSSKLADHNRSFDMTRNAAAAGDVARRRTEDAASARVLSSEAKPEPCIQPSPGYQATHTTPTVNDQTGPLEPSLESGADVSFSSEGSAQSSSSRMLTKRLPNVASKSGSRSGTPPVPSSSQKSLPCRPSFSPSPVQSATAACGASPSLPSTYINESYDCIPEVSRKSGSRSGTPPMPSSSQNLPYRPSFSPSPVQSATATCGASPSLSSTCINESYGCIPEVSHQAVTYHPTRFVLCSLPF